MLKFPKTKVFKDRKNVRAYRFSKEKCELCDTWTGDSGEVHHIKFRSQGGGDEDGNLIYLCQPCHSQKAHGVNSREYRSVFEGIKANDIS